jgi:hypothetical protein
MSSSGDSSLPVLVTPIQRQRTIEGTTIAGIIRNVGYHFCDVEIFADGMINAWELNDLPQFASHFEANSLRIFTSIPDGEILSIYGLGTYRVTKARWRHTPQSYLRRVEETLRVLNPELSNLYCVTQQEMDRNKHWLLLSQVEPYRVTADGYRKEPGRKTRLFVQHDSHCLLADVCVFKSGSVRISHPDLIEEISLEELDTGFREGRFLTSIETPREVSCGELGTLTLVNTDDTLREVSSEFGTFTLVDPRYGIDVASKREELHTMFDMLDGRDRHEQCRQAYFHYLQNPSDSNRDRLREAYEKVPEHQRAYLGDMDTRNTDYERILYSSEKREV